jgi:hypothetical protein
VNPGSILIRHNPVTEHEYFCLNVRRPDEYNGGGAPFYGRWNNQQRRRGGYWSASFVLQAPENVLKEMYEHGHRREVRAWDASLDQVFEGMIDEMVFIKGGNRYTSSMRPVVNEIWMRSDHDGDGSPERSTTLQNTDSISRFGTIQKVLSGGEMASLAVADQTTQAWLNRRGLPFSDPDFGGGSQGAMASLEVYCRGYIHTLADVVYNNAGGSGTENVIEQFQAIVGERASVFVKKPSTWDSTLGFNDGTDGDADAVSPDWDKEAGEALGDFDSVVDADGDLNAAVAAVKIGTNGYEVTFDNGTVAYGQLDGSAVDRTQAALNLWFKANDVAIQAGTVVNIANFVNGTPQDSWWARITPSGATHTITFLYRTDAGTATVAGTHTISSTSAYVHIRMVFKRSTGAGNNDGYMYARVDDNEIISTYSATGIDNDTRDWDFCRTGMVATSSTTFGGSFYFDEVKLAESISPVWVTEAAARDGAYGAAFTIEDTTARYVEDTSPTNETELAPELWFDPSGLSMGDGDEFVCASYIEAGGGVDAARLVLGYENSDDYHYLYTQTRLDGGAYTDGAQVVIPSHHGVRVRMHILFSSTGGADDGRTYLLINDRQRDAVTGLDNDTLNIDTIRYGAVSGLDATTTGVLKMDTLRYSTQELIEVTEESGVCEYVRAIRFRSNPTPTKQQRDSDREAMDQIFSNADMGDSTYRPWSVRMVGDLTLEFLPAAPIEVET